MRRRRRYTVHRRLLLTFLLLGSAGSFVLGQEVARAYAALPVYAAQALTFSGAGITASLVTPIQATGSVGQPTPQPKVVKHPSKPKSKGPTAKPVTPPQPAPVTAPPIVLQGNPVGAPPTTSPCVATLCIPGAKPEPPVVPPPSTSPTGTAASDADTSSSSSSAQTTQCAPLGLVTRPKGSAHVSSPRGDKPAQCSGDTATGGGPSKKTPKPATTQGATEAPSDISAPQGTLPAPVVNPVVPVIVSVIIPVVALAETSALPTAGGDLAGAGDQTPPSHTSAAAQPEQHSQG